MQKFTIKLKSIAAMRVCPGWQITAVAKLIYFNRLNTLITQ